MEQTNKSTLFQRNYSTRSSVSQDSETRNLKIRKVNSICRKRTVHHFSPFSSISPSKFANIDQNKSSSLSPNHKNIYRKRWLVPLVKQLSIIQTQLPPNITAKAYCAILSDTQQILSSKNIQMVLQIASLTKIMTAYTVICISHTFGIKIKEHKIKIHRQSSGIEGTTASLRGSDELSLLDLLYGLLLPSGNDAAITLAHYFGKILTLKFQNKQKDNFENKTLNLKGFQQYQKSAFKYDFIKQFVAQMNRNSKDIGLTNTCFNNPTGLNDPKCYSTAKDISTLTSHCLKNHVLRDIFKKKVYICSVKNQKLGGSRQLEWRNTNKHLFKFRDCIGVKTGVTPNAGPCLSSAYRIFGRQLIIILLKSNSIDERFNDAQDLYIWCAKKIKP